MEDKRTRAKMLYNHLKNIGLVSTQDDLAKKIKYNRVSVSKALNGYEDYLTRDFARAINTTFGNVVDVEWLITGEGEMLKSEDPHNISPQFEILDEPNGKKGLIPFYGDVQSTGGDVSLRADVDVSQTIPSSWIDAGDFFREATAIIEHVGESMVEYPNKCMIAIKKVEDVTLLVNGDVYVIETSEYRVTKKVLDNNNEYITGYSTNPETYPDGQLIYAPMKIPKDKIRAMYTVLGYAYVRHGQKIVLRTKK